MLYERKSFLNNQISFNRIIINGMNYNTFHISIFYGLHWLIISHVLFTWTVNFVIGTSASATTFLFICLFNISRDFLDQKLLTPQPYIYIYISLIYFSDLTLFIMLFQVADISLQYFILCSGDVISIVGKILVSCLPA